MAGLAELQRYSANIKKCRMAINNKYCYFYLSGATTYDFLDALNYKSWLMKTYQKNVNMRYVNVVKKLEKGNVTLRTSLGFAPLLMRLLRIKGYSFTNEDIDIFKSRLVVFPDLKLNLYDFQNRMVFDWLKVGGIGVVKSPTGSGKCCRRDTLILTDRGMFKIEDLVKKKEQTTIEDHFIDLDKEKIRDISVISLQNSLSGYRPFKISDRFDIGEENLVSIKTRIGLKISGTKEHPIIVLDKKGRLVFKKLENIREDDYVAIAYNTQIYNEKLELKYHYRPSKFSSNLWKLDNIKCMNEEIARLLGYVIAEANASVSDNRALAFQISNYDKEIHYDIINICKNLGIDVGYRYDENKNEGDPTGIIVNSAMFTEFMYYLGYKHLAQNKEVPWSILQANKKCQIEFLKGLFDGDGTVYEGDSKDIVEINSSS